MNFSRLAVIGIWGLLVLPAGEAYGGGMTVEQSRCERAIALRNNLKDCREPAKSAVIAAKTKWAFEYDCEEGKVTCISAGEKSQTIADWPGFVIENARMFGEKSSELVPGERRRDLVPVMQLWKGLPIDGLGVGWWAGHRGENLVVPIRFLRTDSWKLQVKPGISEKRAVELARDQWVWPFLIKRTRLMIRAGQFDGCGSLGAPVLAWKVEGYAFIGAPYPHCNIDAQTGRLCGECDLQAVSYP